MPPKIASFRVRCFSVPKLAESLSEEPSEWPVLGLTLKARQERAILWAGGDWAQADAPAQVWIRKDTFISEDALKLFVQTIHKRGRTQESLYWNPTGELGILQERLMFGKVEPLMYWFGSATADPDFSEAKALDVEPNFQPFSIDVPKEQFGVDMITIPLTDYVVLPTLHWLQLLWANFIGLGPFLWRELGGRNAGWIAWRAIQASIRTRSVRPHKLIAGVRRIGKKCQIHPSAVVEACWIGDNVKIGANAVVRGCVIADDVRIEDLAMVEYSFLDCRAVVQRQAMVKFSVLCMRSAVAGVIQLSVMDRASSLKRGAYLLDMSFGEKKSQVTVDGVLHDAPLGFVGCCVGACTHIGLGVRVAPGRTLPPNLQITSDPEVLLRRVPKQIEGAVFVRAGTLMAHQSTLKESVED